MSDVAVRFREYTSHGHAPAVTNAQDFYTNEVRTTPIDNGVVTLLKTLGSGKPKKVVRENRFGKVKIEFLLCDSTLEKLQNLKALADSNGRIVVYPSYTISPTLERVVMLPDEQILDNLLVAGYGKRDTVEVEFLEVEHEFPVRMLLIRNKEMDNTLSTTDGTEITVTQVDAPNSMIRLSWLPNIASLFTPVTGKEWCIQSQEDNTGTPDPYRDGDYTHHLKVVAHGTYTAAYMYNTKWLKIATCSRGTLSDFSVGEKVCLINPHVGYHEITTNFAAPIVTMLGSGWRQQYVNGGGLFKHTDGDFVVLVNGYSGASIHSVGAFKGASLAAASLTVLNSDAAIFVPGGSGWRKTSVFAAGSVHKLDGYDYARYIVFISGYNTTDGKWRIGWAKFDEDFIAVEYASDEIIVSTASSAGLYVPSVEYYRGEYWMAYVDRSDNSNPESATGGWKVKIAKCATIDGTYVYSHQICAGKTSNDGSWRSCHSDIASLIVWKGELYCLVGGTAWYFDSGVRNNRVVGLFKYDDASETWIEDTRSPILFTPMYGDNIWNAAYSWCNDHTSGYEAFFEDKYDRKLYCLLGANAGTNTYQCGVVSWDLMQI